MVLCAGAVSLTAKDWVTVTLMAEGADRTRRVSDDCQVVEIDIPARFDLVTVVRMIVAAGATAADSLVDDRLDDLRWACSEATTNAIQANQATEEPGRIRIRCEFGKGRVGLQVVDEGPGLARVEVMPDMNEPERLSIEGGFGIPLMETLASGPVTFESNGGGTTVTLELLQERRH